MPEPYGLRHLAYAVAVAEEGSISAAARRLRIGQPTLSRQLRSLEDDLGATLFTRGPRRLEPTPAGRVLVERARLVLREADALGDEVRRARRGEVGRLTIAFAGSAINGPLGAALGRIRRDLPDIELTLAEEFDDSELTAGVRDRRFDVAVQRLPERDPRLESRPWTREPLRVFLPTGHPLAGPADVPVDPADLGPVPFVMWPRSSAPRAYDEVMALCHRAGVVPDVVAQGRTVQSLLALVANGFGVTVMAESYGVLRRAGTISRVLVGATTTTHLVWRAGDTNPVLPRLWSVLEA